LSRVVALTLPEPCTNTLCLVARPGVKLSIPACIAASMSPPLYTDLLPFFASQVLPVFATTAL
jgi:hypothetical protein